MIGRLIVHAKHNTIKVQDVFLLKKIDFLSRIVFYRFTSHSLTIGDHWRPFETWSSCLACVMPTLPPTQPTSRAPILFAYPVSPVSHPSPPSPVIESSRPPPTVSSPPIALPIDTPSPPLFPTTSTSLAPSYPLAPSTSAMCRHCGQWFTRHESDYGTAQYFRCSQCVGSSRAVMQMVMGSCTIC